MPTKKQLTRIFLFSAAGILVALSVAGIFLKQKPLPAPPSGPVVIQTTEKPAPEVVAVAPATPAPAPTETLPEGACTLLVDKTPVLTLASEEELKELLGVYLKACAIAPEGERFLSATFACELIFVHAAADAHLSAYDDALTLLTNAPKTVPVRLMTEKIMETQSLIETRTENDAALAKGSRIILQLGFAGFVRTTAVRSYVAGEPEPAKASDKSETVEGRAQLIRVGAWTSRGETPAKELGKKGKDAGTLSLHYPMRGNVTSYFGMRGGNMHNGIDIQAAAGTAISAPGEGVVVYCGERGAYGCVIDIDHGSGFLSRLTHIDPDSILVEYNQRVFQGDQLGTLAASSAKKPHLHYELLIDSVPFNPQFYIG